MTSANADNSFAEHIDDELREGIQRALEEDPDALREKLAEMGVFDQYVEHSDISNDNKEPLSEAEQLLLDFVETLQNPKSTQEIATMIQAERPDLIEEYGSFKHRSWLSTKLNRLAKVGYIGKFRKKRTVLYTPNAEEAIRRWALYNNKFANELTRSDADRIVADTGMNRDTIIKAIATVQNRAES